MLWTSVAWTGHLPVCPVAVECEVCAEARKTLTGQVHIPPHDSVWASRRLAPRPG